MARSYRVMFSQPASHQWTPGLCHLLATVNLGTGVECLSSVLGEHTLECVTEETPDCTAGTVLRSHQQLHGFPFLSVPGLLSLSIVTLLGGVRWPLLGALGRFQRMLLSTCPPVRWPRCVFFRERSALKSSAHFSIGLFVIFLSNCNRYLETLETRPV